VFEISQGIGPRWYGVSYAMGFLVAWLVLRWLARTGRTPLPAALVGDYITWCVVGVVVGGRLGHALFYDRELLWTFTDKVPWWELLAIQRGGMASHGGVIGVVVASMLFARRHGIGRLEMIDTAAFITPPGLMFGRLANWVNGELPGKLLPQAMQPEAQLPWFLPAISGKKLRWFKWQPTDPMPGFSDKGLRESRSACDQSAAWRDHSGICGVCFVPALAVDMRGHRLGYGGGYYDRFFASHELRSHFLLVSCVHPSLMVQELPSEDHDIQVDISVTFEGVTHFGDTSQILKKLGTTKEDGAIVPWS
jgi:5,10-methenyltetrahydrofolate synthetase